MLATDWFGHCMADLGDEVTIAVKLPTGEPLIVHLTRSATPVAEKYSTDRTEACSLGYSDLGAEIAPSALNGCHSFYWGTTSEPVGYDITLLWPPPDGNPNDLDRVRIPNLDALQRLTEPRVVPRT